MRVLVVGGGGREHALAWKISRSPLAKRVFAAPGNAGIGRVADLVAIPSVDLAAIVRFAKEERIDLVVVGPEASLCEGLADSLLQEGVRTFGPRRAAARLEGSKAWAKGLMRRYRIPTAAARMFTTIQDATAYLESLSSFPIVVKASGLAAGKGVQVSTSLEQAVDFCRDLLSKRIFGDAGAEVVIEEALVGTECSLLALTDGNAILALEPVQDHKRVFDGDEGPNTGGMGAFSPVPALTPRLRQQVEREILVPILHALRSEEIDYRGVLYAGLMLTPSGPKVLEWNVRFGDPETQPLLLRLRSDLLELLLAVAEGRLDEVSSPEWDDRTAVCVVLASGGYPGAHAKGLPIHGLEAVEEDDSLRVFHAGTARAADGGFVTSGGRVVGVTALGSDLAEARARAYAAAARISFQGIHYRKDLGLSALGGAGSKEVTPPRSPSNEGRSPFRAIGAPERGGARKSGRPTGPRRSAPRRSGGARRSGEAPRDGLAGRG